MTWYYSQNGQRFGPLELSELQRLARSGALRSHDLVIQAGAQKWVPASAVNELFPAVKLDNQPAVRKGPPPLPAVDQVVLLSAETGLAAEPILIEIEPESGLPGWLAFPLTHIRRAMSWDLRWLSVTPGEQATLRARGTQHPSLHRYFAWRRSVLFVTFLPALLLAILGTIDTVEGDHSALSALGRICFGLFILAPYAMPVSVVIAALTWANQRWSGRTLVVGWCVSFLLPLALLLLPAHWLFDFGEMPEQARQLTNTLLGLVMGLGIFAYLCMYLPVFVVSASFGVQRASLRLKTLLPTSTVPGLFLAGASLVFPLAMLPFFALMTQIASSPLVLLGVPLLMAASLVYAFRAGVFVRPLTTPEDFAAVRRIQWVSRGLFWAGTIFLLIYALTKEWPAIREGAFQHLVAVMSGQEQNVDVNKLLEYKTLLGFSEEKSYVRPWNWRIIRWLVIETLGRSLFTTILIADLFMRVSLAVWRHTRAANVGPLAENDARLMGTLNRAITRGGADS